MTDLVDRLSRYATFKMKEFRDDSRQLYELTQDVYGSIKTERDTVMFNSAPPLRYLPLGSRVCADLRPQYVREPLRDFDRQPDAFSEAYRASRMNAFLRHASRVECGQRSQIVVMLPGRDGGLRPVAFSPWEVQLTFDDPSVDDIRYASEARILWPIESTSPTDGNLTYGRLVLTPTEAYISTVDGMQKRPIYTRKNALTPTIEHDFPHVPVAGIRQGPPIRLGLWFPSIDYPLLSLVIASCLGLGLEELWLWYSHPRRYITGPGSDMAPDEIADVVSGERVLPADTKVDVAHINPPSEKLQGYLKRYAEMYATARRLSAAQLLDSRALTGDALEIQRQDFIEARTEVDALYADFETDLARLYAMAWNRTPPVWQGLGHRPVVLDEGVTVDVEFRHPEARRNDLQVAQAFALNARSGLDSPDEAVARAEGRRFRFPEGVDRNDAAQVAQWRIDRAAELLGEISSSTPGIDQLDNNATPTTGPRPVDEEAA